MPFNECTHHFVPTFPVSVNLYAIRYTLLLESREHKSSLAHSLRYRLRRTHTDTCGYATQTYIYAHTAREDLCECVFAGCLCKGEQQQQQQQSTVSPLCGFLVGFVCETRLHAMFTVVAVVVVVA